MYRHWRRRANPLFACGGRLARQDFGSVRAGLGGLLSCRDGGSSRAAGGCTRAGMPFGGKSEQPVAQGRRLRTDASGPPTGGDNWALWSKKQYRSVFILPFSTEASEQNFRCAWRGRVRAQPRADLTTLRARARRGLHFQRTYLLHCCIMLLQTGFATHGMILANRHLSSVQLACARALSPHAPIVCAPDACGPRAQSKPPFTYCLGSHASSSERGCTRAKKWCALPAARQLARRGVLPATPTPLPPHRDGRAFSSYAATVFW